MTEEQKTKFIVLSARTAQLDQLKDQQKEISLKFLENLQERTFEDALMYSTTKGILLEKEKEVSEEMNKLLDELTDCWAEIVTEAEKLKKEKED